jgi:hypothetical protein
MYGDLFFQPGRCALHDQTVVRRNVTRPLVIQVLNRSADLNSHDISGYRIVEVNPESIGLRAEQLGTRGGETRAGSGCLSGALESRIRGLPEVATASIEWAT